VLILGEHGTGKDIAAARLHYASSRWAGPFVKVNCAALSTDVLEVELIGERRRDDNRSGMIEQAEGGTLFLDEIAEMDLSLQAKLLGALRHSERRSRAPDVRLVSATNQNLGSLIRAGRFREDLYYRIAGLEIVMPPLRTRSMDIRPLALEMIERFCFDNNRRMPTVSEAAMLELEGHVFTGNVRELQHIVHRTLLLIDGDVIEQFLRQSGVT
jgi:DNA-binding NtrC family response regulator